MYLYQEHNKDCLQCTLANLLDISYDLIPEFYLSYDECREVGDYLAEFDSWLEKNGLYRILYDVKVDENCKITMPVYTSAKSLKCIGVLEKKGREYSHAVLMEVCSLSDGTQSLEILHDPKRNTDYDIKDLVQIEIICKL